MLFDCFLEQCFPWQANKSDLSILKVQLLWTQSELPKQKKRESVRDKGFYCSQSSLSQICFGFLLFILQQRGPATKLLITEWTAVMSPDASRDFLILDQNNLMFDLRWKKTWANSDHMVQNSISSSFFLPFLSFFLGLNILARVRRIDRRIAAACEL